MNWNQRVQLALWAVASIAASVFLSFISLIFLWLPTIDLHKNSSAPGDFAETDASIIAADILKRWIIAIPIICLVIWCIRMVAVKLAKSISTPPTRRQVSAVLFAVVIFTALLLGAVQLLCGIDYWRERASHFPKQTALHTPIYSLRSRQI